MLTQRQDLILPFLLAVPPRRAYPFGERTHSIFNWVYLCALRDSLGEQAEVFKLP